MFIKEGEEMQEKDCLILQYLYEELNLTKAAERVYMTQPALTYRLRQLEREFQVEIISKNGKKVKFTPAGAYLVSYANKYLSDFREAKDYLLNMGDEVKGNLRIGVSSHFCQYNLPPILKEYTANYPNVHLNVDSGFSKEMMGLLNDGEIDVAIVRGDYNWSDKSYLLDEESICLITKQEINIEDLPSLPFINRKEPFVLIKYKNSKELSDVENISSWWNERYESSPNTTMLVDSYETCKEMVKMGLGFSIVPQAFIHSHDHDHLFCYDLAYKNGQKMKKRTWLLYRESSLQLAAIFKFVESIKALYYIKKD
jgi:DNA-binding transcriptional LysR family regulator